MYKFYVAKSPSEVSDCQALLRRVFIEEEGFDLSVPDEFEPRSVYLYCSVANRVIACLRIIKSSQGSLLPIQKIAPSLSFENFGQSAEISRLVIAKEYRGKLLTSDAYRLCWMLGRDMGVEHFVVEARYSIRQLHKRIGFREYEVPFYDADMQESGRVVKEPNAVAMVASVAQLLQKHRCPTARHVPSKPVVAIAPAVAIAD